MWKNLSYLLSIVICVTLTLAARETIAQRKPIITSTSATYSFRNENYESLNAHLGILISQIQNTAGLTVGYKNNSNGFTGVYVGGFCEYMPHFQKRFGFTYSTELNISRSYFEFKTGPNFQYTPFKRTQVSTGLYVSTTKHYDWQWNLYPRVAFQYFF